MAKVICIGQRPQNIGTFNQKKKFKEIKRQARKVLIRLNPDLAITGMTIGWGQWIAEICIDEGISFLAALPCEGQEIKWPPKVQQHYNWLLSKASKIIYIDREEGYISDEMPPGVYHLTKQFTRNQWMIDQMEEDDRLLSLWNQKNTGGTASGIQYYIATKGTNRNTSHVSINPNTFDNLPF